MRLAVAERADIIVDFGKIKRSRLYLVNRLEQVNGRGPTGKILTPGTPIVQINVGTAAAGHGPQPRSRRSASSGRGILRHCPIPTSGRCWQRPPRRRRGPGVSSAATAQWKVNGKLFDPDVISANITQEAEEVWVIQNPGGGWRHPIHIHFEEHRVLRATACRSKSQHRQANGTIDYARRDVIPLNDNNEVRMFMRFRDMKGRYVMHCHNVVHEDHAMMIRWDIVSETGWRPARPSRAGARSSAPRGNRIHEQAEFFVGAAAAASRAIRRCVGW